MSAKHRAWLVDLDGTLYRARPVKIRMAIELGLGGLGVVNVLKRFRQEHETLRHSLDHDVNSPFMEQIERTAEALGRDPDAVRTIVEEWMVQRPCKHVAKHKNQRLLDEIRAFRVADGKTACVTDYPARSKLEALGAVDLFDVVVASGEPAGPPRLKPHPAGYLRAAELLGVAPEHCLVIGDRNDADGLAAEQAGMAFRKERA